MEGGLFILLAAVVSVIGGVVTLLIGRRIDRSHGIPTDLESKLFAEMKEYTEALEKRNVQLENEITDEREERIAAMTDCETKIEEEKIARELIARRLDDAEITITRLRLRLGETL